MSFTAPATPSPPFYIGKGLRGSNSVIIDIFGYPIPNSLSSDLTSLTAPYTIRNSTTLFDVSSLTPNHEVPVVLYVSPNNIYSAVTYTISWYRKRDSKLVAQVSFTISAPPPGEHYTPGSSAASWMGWLSDTGNGSIVYPLYREIQENGDYYVNISASGGESFSQDVHFIVSGIPTNTYAENAGAGDVDWFVRLSEYFYADNYIRAGICLSPFTNGQSYEPDDILDYEWAPSITDGCTAVGTVSGLTSGIFYTLYGFAQAADGNYYQAGSYTVQVSGKPPNFSWDTPKVQGVVMSTYAGQPAPVTAVEWNKFTTRINEYWEYRGYSGGYAFTTAFAGADFAAFMFNQLRSAISPMGPSIPVPGSKSTGNPVNAADLNGIVDSYNSLPD